MDNKKSDKTVDKEVEASKRRATRLKEIKDNLDKDGDSDIAKLLKEIEEKNKK